jgi:hypothetical protein
MTCAINLNHLKGIEMIRNDLFCILLVAACHIAGVTCSAAEQYQKILILSSKENDSSRELYRNVSVAFKNVKLNFTNIDSGSYEIGDALKQLNSDDLLVIATDDLSAVVSQPKIVQFVARGGRVFFPVLGAGDSALSNLAGVKNATGSVIVTGFNALVKFFPGLENPEIEPMKLRSVSCRVELDKTAEVIVTAENKFPLVWRFTFGKGKILVFNSHLLADANYCGMLLQLSSMINDYFITTVFNAKVVFIDDFPFPVTPGTEYVISSNYDGRSYDEFYKDIWWPQIKDLATKYKLKYTCLVLANYENSVEMPPVKISDRTKEIIGYYGKDIIKSGHELGIHGYNHASLLMADYSTALKEIGYSPWKSIQDMETSLTCLKKTLDEKLGKEEYFTYVPPMNMLSKEGKKAVLNVFPGIKCFAGLSDVTAKEDGVLHQEVGPDPDFPEVYDLPRISFGELYKNDEMWTVYNYIAYYGLFSHFFHPDDLMDAERSANKDWKQLHDSLEKIVGNVTEMFPFLRGMTAKEFVEERLRTDKIKVYSSKRENIITLVYVNGDGPLYHYLRLNNGLKIKEVKNGNCKPIGTESGLYLLEGLKSPVQVILE